MIIKKIRKFLETDIGFRSKMVKGIRDDESLFEKGIVDSVGVLHLVSFIEKEFGINIEIEDIIKENFTTLKKIEQYILDKKRTKK